MLKHIKNLLKGSFLYIAILVAISIAYLSLIKLGKQPISISHLDKIEHAIAYFILTISWLFAVKKASENKKIKYIVVFACIFYGIIIELLQTTLTSYREASSLDILANSVGAIIAMLIFNIKIEKKQAI